MDLYHRSQITNLPLERHRSLERHYKIVDSIYSRVGTV